MSEPTPTPAVTLDDLIRAIDKALEPPYPGWLALLHECRATLERLRDEQRAGQDAEQRYQAVQQGYWWRVKIGDGEATYGKFYSKTAADEMCFQLLRAFRDGLFVGNERVATLRAENEQLNRERAEFHQAYRMKCDAETKAQAVQIESLRAENERLRGIVGNLVGMLENCSVESGICCCGDAMDKHGNPMDCGHSPVDSGEYAARSLLDEARAALDAARAGEG